MTYRDMTFCLGDGCRSAWKECLRHISRVPESVRLTEPVSMMNTGFVDGVCEMGIFKAEEKEATE